MRKRLKKWIRRMAKKWKNTTIYRKGNFAELFGRRWRCLRDNQASPPGQNHGDWTDDTEPGDSTVGTPDTPDLPRMYMCSPRIRDQRFVLSSGNEFDFRRTFDRQSGIPSDRTGYVYWMLIQKNWWPSNGFYLPSSPEELNQIVFDGVDMTTGDYEDDADSWASKLLRFHDDRIFNRGECIPEKDILVFDFEIDPFFYTLSSDMLYRFKADAYDVNGNVYNGDDFYNPEAIHRPPFRMIDGTNTTGSGINQQLNPIYQPNKVDQMHEAVIQAYKKLAAICRRRYGFKTVANYGMGGFTPWWHGLRSRSLGQPGETVFDDDAITNINPNWTYRKWMKWSWRRIIQRWEDYGLLSESTPGEGDYLDKIMCLPKQNRPETWWGWPYSDDRGFEEVVREQVDAFTPWKDQTLLLVNNYYSFNEQDLSGPSLWDQAYNMNQNNTRGNVKEPINVNYRSATETPPPNTDVTDVDTPLKLNEELDRVLPIYFKYAPDWDICDFNNQWVQYDRWTLFATESNQNYRNARTKYWLAGYDGNYESDDTYNFLFQRIWIPWYQKLWNAYSSSQESG